MTQEDIIKLAREAGLYVGRNISGVQLVGSSYEEGGLLVHLTIEELERFAALVAKHEREACAKICADIAMHRDVGSYGMLVAHSCANEILARGQA